MRADSSDPVPWKIGRSLAKRWLEQALVERRTKHRRGDGMSHGRRCGGGRVKRDGCRRAGVSEQMAAIGDDDTPDSGDRGCNGTGVKVHMPRQQ